MHVNLKAKPFNLTDAQCRWVEEMKASLSPREKAGQLICCVSAAESEEQMWARYQRIPYGGVTFRAAPAAQIKASSDFIQRKAKIPLLISANLESGGSGVVTDGTEYASQLEVAATGDEKYAEMLGDISGAEAAAVGVNYAFAPVVDVHYNWRNPIINIRTYGSDPEIVRRFGAAYMRGIAKHNVAVAIKHFPGDGVDERDQHLMTSVNTFSCEEWDATYGMIYRDLIERGAQTVMVGHIMLPAYSRRLVPGIRDEEIMPASVSPEIVGGLLRGRLGFNGAVITDSAVMTGLSCSMPRRDVPAACINAGCDMFLFGRNIEEDFENLVADIESGVVSSERLDEALTRVLALKASLGLNTATEFTRADYAGIVGCEAFHAMEKECADHAITLVKDTQHLLPLSPEKHRRVWLHIMGDHPSFRGGSPCKDAVIERLTKAGFEVTYFDKENPGQALSTEPVSKLKKKYDLILYVANTCYGDNNVINRLSYVHPMCGESPQYVRDIPTLFVSLGNPYHLVDVPMIKTFINCYNHSPRLLDALMEKLLGQSEFRGVSPVDPFCGMWGTNF